MKRDLNPEIMIEVAQSYTYDLRNGMLTIFNVDKPDTAIKFHLTTEDRNKIANRYYDLRIDKLKGIDTTTGTTWIKDECMVMPQLFTILQVKTKATTQKIQIDESCDDFYLHNFRQAARVKAFLKFVFEILNTRPEIKNHPASDIMYL